VEVHCATLACGCDTVRAIHERVPDSVRQLAIYTRTDGIVDWRFCMSQDPARNLEVAGTHMGLAFNLAVYRAIAAQLGRTASDVNLQMPTTRLGGRQ
jgi:triacylglycerol lipase